MGRRIDHDWIVEEGFKPGERIVVEGVQKVHDGAPLIPSRGRRRHDSDSDRDRGNR